MNDQGRPPVQPINAETFGRLLADHSGMPQCQKCQQPQRCLIGQLLDTIGTLGKRKGTP